MSFLRLLHDYTPPGLALYIYFLLALTCLWVILSRSVISLLMLVFMLGLWLLTNRALEGSYLIEVAPTHSLTQGDVVGIGPAALAVLVWLVRRLR